MADSFYQTVNFHFKVEFTLNEEDVDVRFQSVSGLDVTMDTEQVKEGGENRFEHVLPVRRKASPLFSETGTSETFRIGIDQMAPKGI